MEQNERTHKSERSTLVVFWLPIILAIIGILSNYLTHKWTEKSTEQKTAARYDSVTIDTIEYRRALNDNARLNSIIESLNLRINELSSKLSLCRHQSYTAPAQPFKIEDYLSNLGNSMYAVSIGDYITEPRQDIPMQAWWNYLLNNGYRSRIFKYDDPTPVGSNFHSRIYIVGFNSLEEASTEKQKLAAGPSGYDIQVLLLRGKLCLGSHMLIRSSEKLEYFVCK